MCKVGSPKKYLVAVMLSSKELKLEHNIYWELRHLLHLSNLDSRCDQLIGVKKLIAEVISPHLTLTIRYSKATQGMNNEINLEVDCSQTSPLDLQSGSSNSLAQCCHHSSCSG